MAGVGPTERIGVLSAGLGGLPALRECMLSRPRAEFIIVTDGALVAAHLYDYERIASRVERALAELRVMGASRVLAPGIPSASADPSKSPPGLARFQESLLQLELDRAAGLSHTGIVAIVVTPALAASWPFSALRSRSRRLSVAICVSATLAPVLDRTIDRDEVSVAIVEQVAASVRKTHADVVIFVCQHAHLVEDAFRRALGRSIAIVDSPRLVARLIEGREESRSACPAPRVSVISASDDTTVVTDVNRYLQAPITGIRQIDLPELSAKLLPDDRISLAYAAFDQGDIIGATSLFTTDATVRSEVPGQPCPSNVATALRGCRARYDTCVSILEEFVSSGGFVGVTGWRVGAGHATDASSQERFSHLFRFRGEYVQELRLLDAEPPQDTLPSIRLNQ